MPWSKKQVKMWYAASDNAALRKRLGVTSQEARRYAAEGVKKGPTNK